MGVNKINFPWDVATLTADITTAKILFNSKLSSKGAKFFYSNIKNFFLNILLDQHEKMHLPTDLIPPKIVDKYTLKTIATNGWMYIEI